MVNVSPVVQHSGIPRWPPPLHHIEKHYPFTAMQETKGNYQLQSNTTTWLDSFNPLGFRSTMNPGIGWAWTDPPVWAFVSLRWWKTHLSATFEGAFQMGQSCRAAVKQSIYKCSLWRETVIVFRIWFGVEIGLGQFWFCVSCSERIKTNLSQCLESKKNWAC